MALVANTCPLLPNVSTTNEATTTIRSRKSEECDWVVHCTWRIPCDSKKYSGKTTQFHSLRKHCRINWNIFRLHKLRNKLELDYCLSSEGEWKKVSRFFYLSNSPIIQIGFRMKRSRPKKPMYFDRQPADQSRMTYSTPKNHTRHISIQKSVSLAKFAYCSIVDNTLNIKQTRTSMKLRTKHEPVIKFHWTSFHHLFMIMVISSNRIWGLILRWRWWLKGKLCCA